MALASELAPPSWTRTLAVVLIAAAGAAITSGLARIVPVEVVGAAVAGLVVVLLISLNPLVALAFLAIARASMEGLQSTVIFSPAGIGISPTDVLSIAFLGGAGLWLLQQARAGNPFWRQPVAIAAFAFLGFSTLTLAYSPSAILGAKDLVKWASAFSAFLVLTAARPDLRRLRQFLSLIVASAVIPLLVGFWQFLHNVGRVVSQHGGLRVEAMFFHPNEYGAYLITISVAVWALRPMVSKRARRVVNVIGIATFISIGLTLSRSTWLGFGLVVLVVGWRYRWVLFGAAVGAAGIALAAPRIFGRATDVLSSSDTTATNAIAAKTGQLRAPNSLQARFSIWSNEIKEWKTSPLLGHGFGFTYSNQSQGSHNDYLRVLVEAGVLGLIVYLAFLLTLLRSSIRAARGRTDLPLAFLGLTLAYLLLSGGLNLISKETFQLYFWLLAGITYVWVETVPPPQPRRRRLSPASVLETTTI